MAYGRPTLSAHWRRATVGALFCLAIGSSTTLFAQNRLPGVKRVIVNVGGHSCPIRIIDPYGGRLDEGGYDVDRLPHQKTGIGDFTLSLECLDLNDANLIGPYVLARYSEAQKKWVADYSVLSARDRALLEPVTKRFLLNSVNSSGIGATQDAINGDPATRSRSLGFCLRHPPLMLCGNVPTVAIPYRDKTGVMPYALKIIRSIEFVDPPAATSPPDNQTPVPAANAVVR